MTTTPILPKRWQPRILLSSRGKQGDPLSRGVLPLAIPGFVVAAGILLFPVGYSVWLSLTTSTNAFTIDNFGRMFTDPAFFQSLRITLFIFIVTLCIQVPLALGLGYLVSLDVAGRRVFLTLLLLPAIAAPVALGLLWVYIYDPTIGPLNAILASIGLPGPVWLGDPNLAPWSIIIVEVWQWTPFMALIISAGIRSLPAEPFEAATVDGASGLRLAWNIGLPLLAPVLTVAMMLRTVDLVRLFDTVYVMTGGGPVGSTTTLNVYGYRAAFVMSDPNYAATLQLGLFAIILIIAAMFMFLRKRVNIEY